MAWWPKPLLVCGFGLSGGIDLLGARNTTLQSLVVAAPPPLVAELIGYSYNTAQLHTAIAAQPWARYVIVDHP